MYHWGGGMVGPACTTHGIPVEAAFSIQRLSVHLLDSPAADLQVPGQFPLAHSP